MAQSLGDSIVKAVNDPCLPDGVRTIDYSGRCMFGKRCLGIVGPYALCMGVITSVIKIMHRDIVEFVFNDESDYTALNQMETRFDEDIEMLIGFKVDQLGKSDVVVYWEQVEVPESVKAS